MANVHEIEEAIARLPPQDYQEFVAWFQEHDQQEWDTQMDRDASAGKLDFLRAEVREARKAGTLCEWPPTK